MTPELLRRGGGVVSVTRPRVHDWAYPAGDAVHDPWPGDVTRNIFWCAYRFNGWHWVAIATREEGSR